MNLDTNLDKVLESNVLFALNFEKVWNLLYYPSQLLNYCTDYLKYFLLITQKTNYI